MIWINLNNLNGGYFNYISGSNSIYLYTGGLTKMQFQTYASTTLSSNASVQTGVWQCWSGAFGGTGVAGGSATASLYLNGNLDNSATQAGPVTNNASIQFGYQGAPCNGLIGPCLFWNREVLAPEQREIYIAMKNRYGLS